MKKTFIILSSVCLLISSCQFETSTSTGISVEESELARISEGTVESSSDGVFTRGEDVHLILYNVGKFKEGEDGLHWFDMDLEVSDEDGNVIFDQTGLLGENGHLKLENGKASSPFATFTPNDNIDPGNYRIKVRIYDKVGNGKATVSKSFTLE